MVGSLKHHMSQSCLKNLESDSIPVCRQNTVPPQILQKPQH